MLVIEIILEFLARRSFCYLLENRLFKLIVFILNFLHLLVHLLIDFLLFLNQRVDSSPTQFYWLFGSYYFILYLLQQFLWITLLIFVIYHLAILVIFNLFFLILNWFRFRHLFYLLLRPTAFSHFIRCNRYDCRNIN